MSQLRSWQGAYAVGLFDARPEEKVSAVKSLRKYLKANPGVNVTFKQVAYITQKMFALDKPDEAVIHNALAESVGLTAAEQSAADSIIKAVQS